MAQQSGDMIYPASYGACVDPTTPCDVMQHVTCMNSYFGPDIMIPIDAVKPPADVPMPAAEKVCGSDQHTYGNSMLYFRRFSNYRIVGLSEESHMLNCIH